MTPSKFLHPEAALADTLGLPRKKISALRGSALVRGEHWQHTGGEVRYSDAGRALLLTGLGVTASAPAADSPPNTPPPAPPPADPPGAPPAVPPPTPPVGPTPPTPEPPPKPGDEANLEVIRTYPLNRRIVLARLADGREACVRVRDSGHLLAGMTMRCRFVAAGRWDLAQRLPRWKGKW